MKRLVFASAGLILGLAGCTHTIKVEPIRVEPIHITLDINYNVERKLDEFFSYEDAGAMPQAESAPMEPQS